MRMVKDMLYLNFSEENQEKKIIEFPENPEELLSFH